MGRRDKKQAYPKEKIPEKSKDEQTGDNTEITSISNSDGNNNNNSEVSTTHNLDRSLNISSHLENPNLNTINNDTDNETDNEAEPINVTGNETTTTPEPPAPIPDSTAIQMPAQAVVAPTA